MKKLRLKHIFDKNGRTLIVAMEHAAIFGPGKGTEKPGDTIRQVIAGGANAIMASFGIIAKFMEDLAPVGVILRSDGAPTILGPDVPAPTWFDVDDALRLGVDGICVSAFPGHHSEQVSLANLVRVTREAYQWNLPVQAEMVPGGMTADPAERTLETVALAARLGCELGADWVKVPYMEGFEQVVKGCYKPVVILGGAKRSSTEAVFQDVRAALDAGAAGVTMGRNIWESEDPLAMTQALSALIHEDASVSQAMKRWGRDQ